MIIQVRIGDSQQRYHYNAPNTIRVGDTVDLPGSGLGSFEGRVTAIGQNASAKLTIEGYAGPIKAIVGKSVPLHVEVTARNKRELLEKIRDIIEDIED